MEAMFRGIFIDGYFIRTFILIASFLFSIAPGQSGPKGQVRMINLVVIHATGGPDCKRQRSFKSGTLKGITRYLKNNSRGVSIHYIVGRKGRIVVMEPEHKVAYHVRKHNLNSIGIELINNGNGRDTYPRKQIESLVGLLRRLTGKYGLSLEQIRGHDELDQSYFMCGRGKKIKRKQDPGRNFPWHLIRAKLNGNKEPVIKRTLPDRRRFSGEEKRMLINRIKDLKHENSQLGFRLQQAQRTIENLRQQLEKQMNDDKGQMSRSLPGSLNSENSSLP